MILLKAIIIILFSCIGISAKAQKIDSIYVNLYTDSLKKGTYNYINVDGLFTDGKYLPLDSSHLVFTSSYGRFYGNDLWIDTTASFDAPIKICVTLRSDPTVQKTAVMYIKKAPEGRLKTADELLSEMRQESKKKKKS